MKLIYDEDGDLIRDDLEEELEIQIKHKIQSDLGSIFLKNWLTHLTQIWVLSQVEPEHIYNPITAMRFWAIFTFQLDNTNR